MKKILIVQNITREGPGLIKEVLNSHNLSYDLVDLSKGDLFPSPKGYAALIILGGPDSANDSTPKIVQEIERAKEALNLHIPILGICLGLQVMVKAAGGQVIKNPVKEIGLYDHEKQPYQVMVTGEAFDPLLQKLPKLLPVFQLHGETVVTTDAMALLAEGKHCRNQIVKIAPQAYGIQCHLELTSTMLQDWILHEPDLQGLDGKKLLNDFLMLQKQYEATGKTLIENFLRLIFDENNTSTFKQTDNTA